MFVPADFDPPARFETERFVLVPLGLEHNERDHEAWMSSRTVDLFEREGFVEAGRFLIHSENFPRYDKNRVTNGNWVVVMQRSVKPSHQ